MNAMVSFNRILGWVYLVLGLIIAVAWLFTRAQPVLRVGGLLLGLGALHLLAAKGFERERPWRWAAQAAPMVLLLAQLLIATR